MLDAVLCILIIGGFFVLRAVLATVFFFYLLPEGDRCPNCDAPTLRVQSRGWNLLDAEVPHELVLRVRLARTAASRTAHAGADCQRTS